MAGRNTRFHDVGIDVPKYLLPLAGKPVIESIIGNLLGTTSFSNVYLVAHQRDNFFRDELKMSLSSLDIDPKNLLYIGETKGQADTANESLSLLDLDLNEPVVFHNADTILLNRNIETLRDALQSGRGGIDVFKADSPSYSYVRILNNEIVEIVEKRVISEWATSGLYGFPSCTVYQEYFSKLVGQNEEPLAGELYISNVINLMIADRLPFQPLGTELENSPTTLVMGSPEEYRLLQISPSFSKYAS